MSLELRIYRLDGKNKIRIAKIKNPNKDSFFAWCRLYWILKSYSVKN